uniref:Uncharacterized protein n=1 Tax=Oryza glumipatula TaxID=40148 RepID=A0A0D9Y6V7_9ORYZ
MACFACLAPRGGGGRILLQTHQILLLRRMTSFRLSTPPMDVAALFLPQSIAEQHVTEVVAITMTMPTSLLPARCHP